LEKILNQVKRLKCAVVGCGKVAKASHLPLLKKIDEVEIVALCDRSRETAEDLASSFMVGKIYTDFSLMLEQERPDFICICTPPQTHFDFSRQAMERGIHVLTEKPATLTLPQMDQLLRLARENKIKFSVVHNFLHNPVTRKALAVVKSGKIGDVLAVDVRIAEKNTGPVSNPDHWSNSMPGGRSGDLSVHAVYLVVEFLGKIKEVKALSRKHSDHPWVKFDELMVLLDAERGLGSFYISCNAPAFSHTMKITGSKRSLYLNNFFMTMVTHDAARPNRLRDFAAEDLCLAVKLAAKSISGLIRGKLGHRWYRDGHRQIITDFVKCIIHDTDPPLNAEGSRECLRVLEEAWSQINP
jgi:predicted dehydrogenase